MSVESFYISADRSQVDRWWRQPMEQALQELGAWRLGGRAAHWATLDDGAVQSGLVEPLQGFQQDYGAAQSLSGACQAAVGRLQQASQQAESLGARLLGLGRARQPSENDRALSELVSFASFYHMLHEAARAGPLTETADLRDADVALEEFLAPLIGPREAERYNMSIVGNYTRPCLPPELSSLEPRIAERLEQRMEPFCVELDPAEVQRRWDRLDQIPQFWERLARQATEPVLNHLRAIGAVARYAREHNMMMLKIGA
jgi:hypothetical protein